MRSGTVLAFDFGLQRIGVAVGDESLAIPHPLPVIAFADNARRLDAVAALVLEWQPTTFVLGMPHAHDATPHPLAAPIQRFARRLHARFGIAVETVDEGLSSWSASRALSQAGVRAKDQKRMLDSMAACEILATWFEARRSGASMPSTSS